MISTIERCISRSSVIGLQMAFEEAPPRMKSTITGVFLFTIFAGDILAGLFSRFYTQTTPGNFFGIMTAMIVVVTIAFYFVGRRFERSA